MCDREHKDRVKDMVNYNQIVNELLTTCHPHSPASKDVPRLSPTLPALSAAAKPVADCEQRPSVEENKLPHAELGTYCKVCCY